MDKNNNEINAEDLSEFERVIAASKSLNRREFYSFLDDYMPQIRKYLIDTKGFSPKIVMDQLGTYYQEVEGIHGIIMRFYYHSKLSFIHLVFELLKNGKLGKLIESWEEKQDMTEKSEEEWQQFVDKIIEDANKQNFNNDNLKRFYNGNKY